MDLDGSDDKRALGANSILSASLAVSVAAAQALRLPLYRYINTLLLHRVLLSSLYPYAHI